MNTNKLTVYKDNSLIRSSYQLTLNEQRVILACIAQIDSRKPHYFQSSDGILTISAKDFATTYNIPVKQAYEALQDASKRLYNRDVVTKSKKWVQHFRWVDSCAYNEGEGLIKLSFTRFVMPYLTMLKDEFTKYQLKEIADVKSIYSIRLFEILIQHKKSGKCIILISDFKHHLGLEKKYNRFADLKKRVIEPAVQELKNKANLLIKWEVKRKGRKLHSLTFKFSENKQTKIEFN